MNQNKPTLLDFYEFIYDRHLIWYNRFVINSGKPWTQDPILQKYKFCNVYRELDKCTIHLIDNIVYNTELSLENKIFNIFLYRRFNTPDFFDVNRYGIQSYENFKKAELIKQMDMVKANKISLFSDAYIICQRYFTSEFRKHDKHVQQIYMLDRLRKDIPKIIKLLKVANYKEAHETLEMYIPLTGGFLAQQYLIDISYLNEFGRNWNINSFVDVGPGAKPAIDMLYDRNSDDRTYEDFCKLLFDSQKVMFEKLYIRTRKSWTAIHYQFAYYQKITLSLSNIQNSLCEFRKYCHLQTNPKKKKRLYKGAK